MWRRHSCLRVSEGDHPRTLPHAMRRWIASLQAVGFRERATRKPMTEERVAPKRPMTVQDLLRHTSGLTYGIFGNSPVDELYRNSEIFRSASLVQMVSAVAALPLAHQPGEAWEYSVSTDVLGKEAGDVR